MRSLVIAVSLFASVAQAAPKWGMAIDEGMGRRVQEVLRAHQAAIFDCVNQQSAPIEGEALIRIHVGPQTAHEVDVLKVEPESVTSVADCVAKDARHWDLSALAADDGDQVVFPLQFKPDPSKASAAVAARMKRLTLAKGGHEAERIEHPVAFFVERGSLEVRYEGDRKNVMTNEVVYFVGTGQMQMSSVLGCQLVRVEASAPPGSTPFLGVRKPPSAYVMAGGQGQVQLFLDGTTAPFALDKMCAKRGTEVPTHTHESDELVYILNGRTHTTLGDSQTDQRAGQTVVIPRGTPHALRVDQDMCGIQVYAPNGPEQRFKQQHKK